MSRLVDSVIKGMQEMRDVQDLCSAEDVTQSTYKGPSFISNSYIHEFITDSSLIRLLMLTSD